MDSVANNAAAHYLYNMLFILGKTMDSAARPQYVEAELYRANKIENFDTAAARIRTDSDAELLFYASHAVRDTLGPVFEYEFEKGTVLFGNKNSEIHAVFKDGNKKYYDNPYKDESSKLWTMLDAIRGKRVVPSTLDAAYSHTLCIEAFHCSMPHISDFPQALRRYDDESEVTWVDGLFEALSNCFDKAALPSESGYEWASSGKLNMVEKEQA